MMHANLLIKAASKSGIGFNKLMNAIGGMHFVVSSEKKVSHFSSRLRPHMNTLTDVMLTIRLRSVRQYHNTRFTKV
jgi:hypothetical protein